MEIVAYSQGGSNKRQDIPSPKGWDIFYGPRDQISHITLFVLLEKEYAPISEFIRWLIHNEEFNYVARFIIRTRWNTWTKKQKIEDAIKDLWIQWFERAVFVSDEGKEHDLKDTLQYMADVGFHVRWSNGEQKMLYFIGKLNRKFGRGRGTKEGSRGAVKRIADRMKNELRQKHTHAIIPGLAYGQKDKKQYNDFDKYYFERMWDATHPEFDADEETRERARTIIRVQEDNAIIRANIGAFNSDIDRSLYIKDYYNQLLQSTMQDIF